MGTKRNPGIHDAYAKALPDEPLFTLVARDPQAPGLLYMWATERQTGIIEGRFPESDMALVMEARKAAKDMITWREQNDGLWRQQNPELPLDGGAETEPAPALRNLIAPIAPQTWPQRPEAKDPLALDGPPRLFAADQELYPNAPHLRRSGK